MTATATRAVGRVVRAALLATLPAWPVVAQQPEQQTPQAPAEQVPPEGREASDARARIARVAAEAEIVAAEPECRALIGYAAVVALLDSINEPREADESYVLAAHDFAVRAERRCPGVSGRQMSDRDYSDSYTNFWAGVQNAARDLARSPPRPTPEDDALIDERYTARLRRTVRDLRLSESCTLYLSEAVKSQLVRDTKYRGGSAGVSLGSYAVERCPEAAFARVWPDVERARRDLRAEFRRRLGERLAQQFADGIAELTVDAECKRRVAEDVRFALLPAPAGAAAQREYTEAGHQHAIQTAASCPQADLETLMGRFFEPSSPMRPAYEADRLPEMWVRSGHKPSATLVSVRRRLWADRVEQWLRAEAERSHLSSECRRALSETASSRLTAAAGLPVAVGLPIVAYDLHPKLRCPSAPMTAYLARLEADAEAFRSDLRLPAQTQGAPRGR